MAAVIINVQIWVKFDNIGDILLWYLSLDDRPTRLQGWNVVS